MICASNHTTDYEAIDLLTQLVNKSLVSLETGFEGSIRYYLLDAIWDFGQEKLSEADEDEDLCHKHLNYYLNFTKVAEPNLRGKDQVRWLDQLGHELPNLRVAMDWGLKTNPTAALQIATAMALFWDIRGSVSEGLSWIARGLNSLSIENHPHSADQNEKALQQQLIQAKAMAVTGFLLNIQTEYKRAMVVLEQSISIYRKNEKGTHTGLAYALLELASCATALGNYHLANICARESMSFYKDEFDLFGISECLLALGANKSDPVRAKNFFLEGQEIKRAIGDINGLAFTLQQLCEITVHETDFSRATDWLMECVAYFKIVGNQKSVVNCLHNLAWIAWVTGDYNLAFHHINKAISGSQDIEEKMLVATNLLMRSDIRLSAGDFDGCWEDVEIAYKIGQEMDYASISTSTRMKKGYLALLRGKIEQAKEILQ